MKPYPVIQNDDPATLKTALDFICRERANDIIDWNALGSRFSPLAGTQTNDNASAGNIGEYISASVVDGSAIVLTSTNIANITSMALTAGDWDVSFILGLTGATATNLAWAYGTVGTTSGALNSTIGFYIGTGSLGTAFSGSQQIAIGSNNVRFSLAAPATVYLTTEAAFSGGACNAFGFIGARRAR